MTLVRLYTMHGALHIDADEIARGRTILRIYTARGNKLSDVARTVMERERASSGVHIANLFASPELAEANYQRIVADMAAQS